MSQNNYRDKVEAHRQTIDDDSKNLSAERTTRSRSSRLEKEKSKSNNKLVTFLGFIFVLIPIAILVYFGVIANNDDSTTVKQATEPKVDVQTNDSPSSSKNIASDDDKDEDEEKASKEKEKAAKEKENAEKAAKEKAAKEKAAQEAEKAEKAEKARVAKEAEARAAKEKEAQEAAARAEREAALKAKKEAEARAAKEKAAKEAEAKKASAPNTQSAAYRASIQKGYLHNARQGDTVQSISRKYYGTEARAAEIRQLNGLASDSVQPGTKIALPLN